MRQRRRRARSPARLALGAVRCGARHPDPGSDRPAVLAFSGGGAGADRAGGPRRREGDRGRAGPEPHRAAIHASRAIDRSQPAGGRLRGFSSAGRRARGCRGFGLCAARSGGAAPDRHPRLLGRAAAPQRPRHRPAGHRNPARDRLKPVHLRDVAPALLRGRRTGSARRPGGRVAERRHAERASGADPARRSARRVVGRLVLRPQRHPRCPHARSRRLGRKTDHRPASTGRYSPVRNVERPQP